MSDYPKMSNEKGAEPAPVAMQPMPSGRFVMVEVLLHWCSIFIYLLGI